MQMKFFVINKGELAERGSHKELLEKDGIYKKLFDMQNFK
jgi:subfamily B ATP-binding cassette protein MsbA